MRTYELTGADLDLWVAKAEGYTHHGAFGMFERNDSKPWCLSGVNDWWKSPKGDWVCGPCTSFPHEYGIKWKHAGPIIERERIAVSPGINDTDWWAQAQRRPGEMPQDFRGPTPLIAAMRAFVASKFGGELPDA